MKWLRFGRPSRLPARGRESTLEFWERVTEVTDEAARRPDPRERERYLGKACAGDPALQREVESLLAQDQKTNRLIDASPKRERFRLDEASTQVPAAFRPGSQVEDYEIRSVLGHGGTGIVLLAEDTALGRKVALKVLRRERMTESFVDRFERERRVLGSLDHPNIARIYSGGILDGVPFFAMEYVEGEPIEDYCDRLRLPIEDRIVLISKVCQALSECHRNLIIHRDLKPSNLLVTSTGEPKLLDFGIAKDLGADGSVMATRAGHQPFTLAYASPEQIRNEIVGTGTDIYSLGVLLYRLLCGHPPYLLVGDLYADSQTICDEEPDPPSRHTMVSLEEWTTDPPSFVPPEVLAEARGVDPRSLGRRLRGDLDSIVLKALEKKAENRFGSIGDLGDDLQRHLLGLPVTARHNTFPYRVGKFLRRHRGWVAIAGLVLVSLAIGVASWRARQVQEKLASAAEEQALGAERRADTLIQFMKKLVLAAEPDAHQGNPLTPGQLLQRSQKLAREDLKSDPELLAHQLEAIGIAFWSLGEQEEARDLLQESLSLRRREYLGDHRLIARSLNNLGALEYALGELESSEAFYMEALEMKTRLEQPQEELSKVRSNIATVLVLRGFFEPAEEIYRQLLKERFSRHQLGGVHVASTLRSLGNLYFQQGDLDSAGRLFCKSLHIRRAAGEEETLEIADLKHRLAQVMHVQGHLWAAEAAFHEVLALRERLLGDEDLRVARTRKELASVYFDLGEDAVGEVLWSKALQALHSKRSSEDWELMDAESRLGMRLATAGRWEEARTCLAQSSARLAQVRGPGAMCSKRARKRLDALSELLTVAEAPSSPAVLPRALTQTWTDSEIETAPWLRGDKILGEYCQSLAEHDRVSP